MTSDLLMWPWHKTNTIYLHIEGCMNYTKSNEHRWNVGFDQNTMCRSEWKCDFYLFLNINDWKTSSPEYCDYNSVFEKIFQRTYLTDVSYYMKSNFFLFVCTPHLQQKPNIVMHYDPDYNFFHARDQRCNTHILHVLYIDFLPEFW